MLLAALALATAGQASAAEQHHVRSAVCAVFKGPRLCAEAMRVTWCESRWRTTARNGQYLGLFQMGASERRTFGHGSTARAQALAAKRYYDYSLRENGYGWRPWSCRP